jgi:hypothetical protein
MDTKELEELRGIKDYLRVILLVLTAGVIAAVAYGVATALGL